MHLIRQRKSLVGLAALGVIVFSVLILFALLFPALRSSPPEAPSIAVNDLAARVRAGDVASIEVAGNRAVARTWLGESFSFVKENDASVPQLLAGFGVTADQMTRVRYVVNTPNNGVNWTALSIEIGLIAVIGLLAFVGIRQSQRAGAQAKEFGRSRHRKLNPATGVKTFADVAGVEEAKQELQEIVQFLKFPEKFAALGARIPQGVLLVGPPGTGKTLISRAVAGEAGVPFFSISGSEFVEMFVGVGASRVRDLFTQAKQHAPCIIFIDEIDAVGRQRGGSGMGGASDEREQTLNQILVEMDGFDSSTNVIVIAATNRPEILDQALLRPGRFDRQVILPAPDVNGRKAVLAVHGEGKPFDKTVDLETLAKATPGFSGADLANLINEAAILAARQEKATISMRDLEEAIDRVIAGPERKSRVMSVEEKELTAYHEAGHAVVGRYLENHDPLHKITIISRGMMGGYTRFLPPEDRSYMRKSQFEDMIASALGGHAAETVVYGEMSTGAGNDIEKASKIARAMVKQYGMTQRLGPIAFATGQDGEEKAYSDKVAEAIDEEVRRIIEEGYAKAISLITEHRGILESLTRELIKRETIEGDDLEAIFSDASPATRAPLAAASVIEGSRA